MTFQDTNTLGLDVVYQVVYGSKLYGTNTPTSDTDLKSIYLPTIDDMLLGKKLAVHKSRVDAQGKPVPEGEPMPDSGVENEYIPFQTFVRDFVQGQTYAVEMAYALIKEGPSAPDAQSRREHLFLKQLVEKFGNCEVYSMVGFAMKQTFDYVHRGQRLNDATRVRDIIRNFANAEPSTYDLVRFDDTSSGTALLDLVAAAAGLETSTTVNNNKTLRTLELNGRSYTESTTLAHVVIQLNKQIEAYGKRSVDASLTKVEYKSLSHAVRVYQQSIELLDTGRITFPRPNVEQLLEIKQGRAEMEAVKALLSALDAEVQEKIVASTQRRKTPELVAAAEKWLIDVLRDLYELDIVRV